MLTALAEEIKFKYKFLQFYQVLFMYISDLNMQRCLTMNLLIKVQVAFLCFEQLPNMQNSSFKIHEWKSEDLQLFNMIFKIWF
jgi:hypothetical protein